MQLQEAACADDHDGGTSDDAYGGSDVPSSSTSNSTSDSSCDDVEEKDAAREASNEELIDLDPNTVDLMRTLVASRAGRLRQQRTRQTWSRGVSSDRRITAKSQKGRTVANAMTSRRAPAGATAERRKRVLQGPAMDHPSRVLQPGLSLKTAPATTSPFKRSSHDPRAPRARIQKPA